MRSHGESPAARLSPVSVADGLSVPVPLCPSSLVLVVFWSSEAVEVLVTVAVTLVVSLPLLDERDEVVSEEPSDVVLSLVMLSLLDVAVVLPDEVDKELSPPICS